VTVEIASPPLIGPTPAFPSAPAPAPAPSTDPPTWAQRWLVGTGPRSWTDEGRRLLLALGLASLFGAALGLRQGGLAIASDALGAPAGILAVAAVAVPAFSIILALANAPIDVMDLASATSRAAARAGLLLAGAAPGAALLAVTCEEGSTVTVMGLGLLLFAGLLAADRFAREILARFGGGSQGKRSVVWLALPAFLAFAAILAVRVWWLALPSLMEAS